MKCALRGVWFGIRIQGQTGGRHDRSACLPRSLLSSPRHTCRFIKSLYQSLNFV
jgi:hypothetical protein